MARIALCVSHVDAGIMSGGDKYTRDLTRLLKKLGHEPVVVQQGSPDEPPGDTVWEGARLVTLPAVSIAKFNHNFYKVCIGSQVDAAIYGTIQITYPRVYPKAVAISHGVPWDHFYMDPDVPEDFWVSQFRPYWAAVLGNVQTVVSCDANTINLFNFLFQSRYVHKFTRIPNFADTELFKPVKRHDRKTVTVLFPRRLDVARGFNETLSVAEMLVKKYPHVRFLYCGHGNTPDATERHHAWCATRERIDYKTVSWDEMPAVYAEADIAVTPTLASEGTSLACLESMASGLPVVATWLTAMPEMVQDGVNGYTVGPTPNAIFAAVSDLIENPKKREQMGQMSRQMALGFSKARWEEKWSKVIEGLLK